MSRSARAAVLARNRLRNKAKNFMAGPAEGVMKPPFFAVGL
jgi:hypothetical protein